MRALAPRPRLLILDEPAHPYTKALMSAIPGHGPRIRLTGEVSSPIDPPSQVCRFASRCPQVHDLCSCEAPQLRPGPRQEAVPGPDPGLDPGPQPGSGPDGAHARFAPCHVARYGVRWPVPVLVAD